MSIDRFRALAAEYHKAILSRYNKEELINRLTGILDKSVLTMDEKGLKQLVAKALQVLGEERVGSILGLTQNVPQETSVKLDRFSSFEELRQYSVAHVTNKYTLKNTLFIVKELEKLLLEFDEVPEAAYLDDTMVLSWYKETDLGFGVILSDSSALFVELDEGELGETTECPVDETLVDMIHSHLLKVNWEEDLH